MSKNIWLIGLSFILFLSFVLFSYIVHKDKFTQFDFNTTVILQDHMPRRFDNLFSLFSDIGSFEPMLILLIVLLIARRKIIAGLGTLFLFGFFHIFELYGKFFVDHPPPPEFMLRTKHQVAFPQFTVRAEFSYPSGHAGRATFIATFLLLWIWKSKVSMLWKVGLSGVIGIYVVTMLISRVYLGEHWTTDVIGGSILGTSLGLLAGWIMGLQIFQKTQKTQSVR